MSDLPIDEAALDILAALQRSNRLVLEAPTGSGKSTRLPVHLLESGLVPDSQEIVILEPRRMAARLLAKRVASEIGEPLGQRVGYSIRFERVGGEGCRVRFITEAILTRRLLAGDPLEDIGCLVFDEFHERSLHTDLGLALARRLQESSRPDLRLIVTSATLNADALAAWFNPCEKLSVSGRQYPVDIRYAAAAKGTAGKPPWEQAAIHAARLIREVDEGDLLIFLPGAGEIRRCLRAIEKQPGARAFETHALYGEMSLEAQERAIEPGSKRKVIAATNVAETSLTIPGVRLVVDSGQARIHRHDTRRDLDSLLVEPIARDSADQRAGRAGRTAPGLCLRLWGPREHEVRPQSSQAEIHRVNPADWLLLIRQAGLDVADIPWLEAPEDEAVAQAELLLQRLGALDQNGAVTETGSQMAAFPLSPRLARLLLEADRVGCMGSALAAVALAQERSILLPLKDRRQEEAREAQLGDTDNDLFRAANALELARSLRYRAQDCGELGLHAQGARRAEQSLQQLGRLATARGLKGEDYLEEADLGLKRCLLAAYPDRLAVRTQRGTRRYRLAGGQVGELRRESVAGEADLLVVTEVDEYQSAKELSLYLDRAAGLSEDWLREQYPDEFRLEVGVFYDEKQRRVSCLERTTFRGLELQSKERGDPPEDEAAALLAEKVLDGTLKLKQWDASVDQLLTRMAFVAHHFPETGITPVDEQGKQTLIEQLCLGARSFKEIKDRPVRAAFLEWLSNEQQWALKDLAPETFTLPRRKRPITLRYEETRAILPSMVQDFYDVDPATLKLGQKVPLVLEMLAPNRRPVQLTDDLAGFWERSYPQVKKDLAGRYPKHEWR